MRIERWREVDALLQGLYDLCAILADERVALLALNTDALAKHTQRRAAQVERLRELSRPWGARGCPWARGAQTVVAALRVAAGRHDQAANDRQRQLVRLLASISQQQRELATLSERALDWVDLQLTLIPSIDLDHHAG